MVEVHLVEVDPVFSGREVEEAAAEVGEDDGGVGELPLAVGLGGYSAAECAAEDLVPEADACEADVGAVGPDVWPSLAIEEFEGEGEGRHTSDEVHKPVYPWIVGMRVPTASRNQDGMYVVANILRIGNFAALRLNDVLHRCLDS